MSRPPSPELTADLSASPYEPIAALAIGGMGEVHKVRHRGFGHEAVMKLTKRISDELTEDLTRRLLREGRVLKSLVHPNIVPALDLGFTLSKRAYLVTELVVGKTLKDEVREHGPLPLELCVEVCSAILSALQVAHEAGVVHRDMKPDNVMLTAADANGKRETKVLDFGVAKILGEEMKAQLGGVPATIEGLMVGTPAFASPEQIAAKPVDGRTDIYGVGGVLFYLLTGRPPFVGLDANEVMVAHLSQLPDPPSRLRPEVSPALDEVVLRALAKEPADRFSTAGDMLRALQAAGPSRDDHAPTEVLPNQDDRFLAPMSTGSMRAAVQAASDPGKPAEVALPYAKTVPLQMVSQPPTAKRTARGTVIGAEPPPASPPPASPPRADDRLALAAAEREALTEIGAAPERWQPRKLIVPVLLGLLLAALIIAAIQLTGVFG